ncbi:hypothetical protein EYF80_022263 [Liparis tanakae]|uniref:Uncharacterized protein n=1 Tax=Liparis tanakae TaxID=230148 RepID=A0A4Z2HNV6_9TELE|nr:hypothetical protein EYF80_022263 [Liparis tanakae]
MAATQGEDGAVAATNLAVNSTLGRQRLESIDSSDSRTEKGTGAFHRITWPYLLEDTPPLKVRNGRERVAV